MSQPEESQAQAESWWLPDFIERHFSVPPIPGVDLNRLTLIDASYTGVLLPEVRMRLHSHREIYINGLKSFLPQAHVVDLKNRLITLVGSPNAPVPFAHPDHAFILEGKGFFPFHAILVAAYCSRVRLDPVTPAEQPETSVQVSEGHSHNTSGDPFVVRVVRLRFRNELVMACFRLWLYRQEDSMLRPAILPSSTSLQSTIVFSNLSRDPDARRELAAEYATAYSELDLWEWVSNVLDCRRLVTMLGVDDERVWASMTVAWDVLLQALNMSCVMRAAVDESRGVDTSAIRALLNRGLGMFEGPSDLDPSE